MNNHKAPEKDGTYPPAPSVEDDASPASSTRNFDDDCHEFDEAYMQLYVENRRLREELGQAEVEEAEEEEVEEAEEEGEESPQILIEYSDVKSPTTSSHPLSAQTQAPNHTHTCVYHEHVSLPLHQHHLAHPRHHHMLHSAPARSRLVHEMPHIHQTVIPPLHVSSAPHRLQQKHQNRHVNHARYPLERCVCGADDSATRLERLQDTYGLRGVFREPRRVERHSNVFPYCSGVSDGYFWRRYESGAERMDSRDGRGAEEAEVFEKFAEVFNAMRKLDADISALRKLLEGLLLERCGGHTW